jgi:hypothetical protein
MNSLRKQLDQAKAAHLAQRYPGDLASQLLPIALGYEPAEKALRRTPRKLAPWVLAATLTSLAAAIAILISLSTLLSRPSAESVPVNPAIAQSKPANLVIPAMPEMPSDVPIVPEYEAFSLPSMTSFPSSLQADAAQPNGPTTQETIL